MSFQDIKSVYMMGIGGIAMGTLATMLKEKGFFVTGSDQSLYPPMSTHLEAIQVPVCQGYRPENPLRYSPDVVVIGNVIRRDNPEAQVVLERGIPYLSMPEAVGRFFLSEHRSIVVAGTHGKSTTSSLLAWLLTHAGADPSAFVGAFLKNWQQSYRLGKGKYMVLEGDEYDTAFFDKEAKFLHYRPHIGIVTSIEYDHADIFPDFEAVKRAFRGFARLFESDGCLILNADDPNCLTLAGCCKGRVITYGSSPQADWRLLSADYGAGEVRFTYSSPPHGRERAMESRLAGRHNLYNTLAAMAAASVAGLSMEEVQAGLLTFLGVRRRQDIVGENGGVLVMDDFAHHPTAVDETIRALRLFYPERRLIAAFEPRTNSSRRSVFQKAYAGAFDGADRVCIKSPPGLEAIPEAERLDTRRLTREIRERGKDALCFDDTDALLEHLTHQSSPGDLVLCMSNGSFDGLPGRLLEALLHRQDH